MNKVNKESVIVGHLTSFLSAGICDFISVCMDIISGKQLRAGIIQISFSRTTTFSYWK